MPRLLRSRLPPPSDPARTETATCPLGFWRRQVTVTGSGRVHRDRDYNAGEFRVPGPATRGQLQCASDLPQLKFKLADIGAGSVADETRFLIDTIH